MKSIQLKLLLFATICLFVTNAFAQQKSITGKVRGSDGNPIAKASVLIKGTSAGTATDAAGDFKISVPGANTILVISSVGFKPKELTVGQNIHLDVFLDGETGSLNEVVVVGYGTQKKAKVTGAIGTISGEALEKRPVSNVSQALQGEVAGLVVSTNSSSGEPGAGMSFNIRGLGSLNGGSPLVLVDGVEQNINQVNPNDIDNISVLKDAAASAIYGARAPYGVILVTTKSGKDGKYSINYNNNFIQGRALNLPQMMNGPSFMKYWNDASIGDGNGVIYSQNLLDSAALFLQDPVKYPGIRPGGIGDANGWTAYLDGYASTNWFKEIYKPSFKQQHNLSVSGGDKKTQYYISGGFYDEQGLMKRLAPDDYKRYNANVKISSQVLSWFKLTLNNRLTTDERETTVEDNFLFYHNIARRWPNMAAHDLYGNWNYWSDIPVLQSGTKTRKGLNNISQVGFELTPIDNLSISGDFNFKWDRYTTTAIQLKQIIHNKDNSIRYADPANTYYSLSNEQNYYFTPNLYLDYNFRSLMPQGHNLKILVGYQQEYNHYSSSYATRSHLISDEIPSLNTAIGIPVSGDNQNEWAIQSGFGRLNYDYEGKYLLELNGRYSGSSRFPSDLRWGFFPGASVGYNIAKESFFQNMVSSGLISQFKLRASYGALGNQNTNANYGYLPIMSIAPKGSWLFNNALLPQVGSPGTVSTNYTWERPVTIDFGLDVSMFDNRLNGSFDYYDRTTFDMQGPQSQLPLVVGASAPVINNSNLRTKGFEISLNWSDKIGENFTYFARALLADNQSTILKYYNPTGSLSNYNVGQKIGNIWGYTSVGLFQNKEEITKWMVNNDQSFISNSTWYPGDVKYKDINGDGKVNNGSNTLKDHGDMSIIGNSNPRYQYSFSYGATWKGLGVSMFWQGIGERQLALGGPYFYGLNGPMWQSAAFVQHADYWTPENTNAYYPRATFDNNGRNQLTQTQYLQNAAYLRLKNVTINYDLPFKVINKVKIKALSVYVTGENLVTFTKLNSIFDPETASGWDWGKVYPLSKNYAVGLNITF